MLVFSTSAAAEGWSPRLELNLMPGTDRLLARLDLMAPLVEWENALWFLDARAVLSDQHTLEGNLGLGYRRVVGDGAAVLGFYGFYDQRRTQFHHRFEQLTFGADLLTETWDLRANLYLPEKDERRVRMLSSTPASTSAASLSGNNILSTITAASRTYSVERSMRGADLELGRVLPFGRDVRGYLAGFHFDAHKTPSMTGGRARIESRVNDVFSMGASYQYDDLRGSQSFLELRFAFTPWGRKNSEKPAGIRRRLADRIIRDVDVITSDEGATSIAGGTTTTSPVLGDDGNPLEVWYVKNDASAGGDGSVETPFDTLAEAETASGTYDYIFVYEGDGTTTGQAAGIALKDNQKLLGEGVGLAVGGNTYIAAGSKPKITSGIDGVRIGNGNEVAGLHIQTPGNVGIGSTSSNGFNIHDNLITDDGGAGIYIQDGNGTGTITDNTVTNSAVRGIWTTLATGTSDLDLTLSGNTLSGVGGSAIYVDNQNPLANINTTISSNTTSSNGGGIAVLQAAASSTTTATISNNNLTSEPLGIALQSTGNNTGIMRATVSGNTITGSTTFGIIAQSANPTSSVMGITVDSNTVNNAAGSALTIDAQGTSDIDVIVNGNTLNGATAVGGASKNTSNLCMEFTNNTTDVSFSAVHIAGTFDYFFDGTNTPGAINTTGAPNAVAQGTCSP